MKRLILMLVVMLACVAVNAQAPKKMAKKEATKTEQCTKKDKKCKAAAKHEKKNMSMTKKSDMPAKKK